MKKHIVIFVFFIAISTVYYSCKKGPGQGGRASIKGKIFAVNYSAPLITPTDSGYYGGQKVYIIFGDETAVGDNQDTSPDGTFEFQFLRKGKYKVYTFSKTKQNRLDSAVIQSVEITERKQVLNLPDFRIKTNKN